MKTGEIHWVELPDVGGREQSGRRPAIIMQADSYAASLPTTVVIPLSSAMAALRFPGTAQVKASESSGLRTIRLLWSFRYERLIEAESKTSSASFPYQSSQKFDLNWPSFSAHSLFDERISSAVLRELQKPPVSFEF